MAVSAVHFEEFKVGARYRTLGRTVSDFEILQFVTLTGFTEPLFMDMEYIRGRACSARGWRRACSPSGWPRD